jgi:tRNA (guanine37-N1)-methyltransferase
VRFDILTIFPEAFGSYLGTSILKRAIARKKISIHLHDIRQAATDKHRTVDDKPYGGGAGMVMKVEPIVKTLAKVPKLKRRRVILFSAKGKPFTQRMASEWADEVHQLVLICGRYEGIDERVKTILKAEEFSIGPYVTTDGEVAAMVVLSAVARLLPGVIRLDSLAEESHWNHLRKQEVRSGQLEYPHYTRPEVFVWKGKRYRVPKILLSGDHAAVAKWRAKHRGRRR